MLLSITTTHSPATDLGFLLHKHPDRLQTFSLTFGKAHVFYPVAGNERCTCTLLVDIDPVELSRRDGMTRGGFDLYPYVNDRPYVASSFLSVAIAEVFGSALNGQSKERPELAATPLPLEIEIPVLPARGGLEWLTRVFGPLGYEVEARNVVLDEQFPEWGASRYWSVRLRVTATLSQVLSHLYVLLPVLDNQKHYWVARDEAEKLLRHAQSWLGVHPEREAITRSYLGRKAAMAKAVLEQLAQEEDDPESDDDAGDAADPAPEQVLRLHDQRLQGATEQLLAAGARRVLDLGCGEGRLINMLAQHSAFTEIVGMDASSSALAVAARRVARLPEMRRERVRLLHGSLLYRDTRLHGYDAAALLEVIEHLEPFRLRTAARVLFGDIRPRTVVMTTPNREYNVVWPSLPAGNVRHSDHRFEWTRAEFESWAGEVAAEFGYNVVFHAIGDLHPEHGGPTQMGVFTL